MNGLWTMTRTGYARHRQVTPAMVTKYGHMGLLVLTDHGLVDVIATDRNLRECLDPSRGGKNGWGLAVRESEDQISLILEQSAHRIAQALASALAVEQKRLRAEIKDLNARQPG